MSVLERLSHMQGTLTHPITARTLLATGGCLVTVIVITIWASGVPSTIVVLCWRSSEPGARTKKQVLRADT